MREGDAGPVARASACLPRLLRRPGLARGPRRLRARRAQPRRAARRSSRSRDTLARSWRTPSGLPDRPRDRDQRQGDDDDPGQRAAAASGLRVGTFTSPDLHAVNERIAVAGRAIDDDDLVGLLSRLADVERVSGVALTRFELLTVAALLHFSDEGVDVAVVEVGMGGTWDSTNVVDSDVAVLTNVDLDHTAVLGHDRRRDRPRQGRDLPPRRRGGAGDDQRDRRRDRPAARRGAGRGPVGPRRPDSTSRPTTWPSAGGSSP